MIAEAIKNPILPGIIGNPQTAGGSVIANFIPAAITLGFVIGTLLFFAYLIWGAIEWITSGGDKQKLESARSKITNAVIGLILLFAAFAVVRIIQDFFHIKILTGLDFSQLKFTP